MKRNVFTDGSGSKLVMIEGMGIYAPSSELDRLTSENARLRDMLKKLTSHDNCRKDVIHLMSEADSLIEELEKSDE